ncbi:MAG: adenylate kinase family protein [Thermoplasmatota archaeon]
MIISLCGTPGVGKTTVAKMLSKQGWAVIDLKEFLSSSGLFKVDRVTGELIVDVDIARDHLKDELTDLKSDIIIEGHLSYLAPWDLCIVMRLHPAEVKERLSERDYPTSKLEENVEAEVVGTILVEAVREGDENRERSVLELDCKGLDEEQCCEKVSHLIRCSQAKRLNELRQYSPGSVDWLEVMDEWY